MKKIDIESGVRIYSKTKQDTIDAMDLIGEKVYVSSTEDFEIYGIFKFAGVKFLSNKDECFIVDTLSGTQLSYNYLILAKDVKFKKEEEEEKKEEEKKLRPYKDISEFCVKTGCIEIGKDLITIRNKNTQKEYELLYVGYSDGEVHLGGYILTFADLLKNYEHALNSFEWLPFGVEE